MKKIINMEEEKIKVVEESLRIRRFSSTLEIKNGLTLFF